MSDQMVFLPVAHDEAVLLRDSGDPAGPLVGHAATPDLLRAHGYDFSALEEAEFAALSYAAVRAVLDPAVRDDLRLVLAADVPAAAVEIGADDPHGTVTVRGLRWSMVRALFVDEPAAGPAVAAARTAAAGRALEAALTLAGVERLSEDHDLLWFNPDELDWVDG